MSKIAAMRVRFTVLLPLALTGLIAPSAASADCVHVVGLGESLTSIAAADGITIDSLAAANGLSPTAPLLLGSCLTIPPQGGTASTGTQVAAAGVPSGDGDGDSDDPGAATTAVGAPAASGSYVVQPGDTLTAIAARAGTTVGQLAAANGLNPAGPLLIGTVLGLSGSSGTSSAATSQPVATGTVGDGDGDSDDPGATTSSASAPAASSSYVVQPGDTLTAIAARAGTTVAQLAATNGLNPIGPLLSGTVLRLSGSGLPQSSSSTASAATSQPVGAAAEGSPTNPPYPTPVMVSPSAVGSIAAANGVPASLADAIAYQESGFNNGLVSSADARGVMQITPGTWSWIQQALTPGTSPLAAASATDNIRGGVLLLRSLLSATGGNAAMAAAGYYQGLPSVERDGIFPSTQQYVNNVMALQQRFGGG